MTDAQNKALTDAHELLREHFDGSLIAVVATLDDNDHKEATKVCWHGGTVLAKGLADEAREWIRRPGAPAEDSSS